MPRSALAGTSGTRGRDCANGAAPGLSARAVFAARAAHQAARSCETTGIGLLLEQKSLLAEHGNERVSIGGSLVGRNREGVGEYGNQLVASRARNERIPELCTRPVYRQVLRCPEVKSDHLALDLPPLEVICAETQDGRRHLPMMPRLAAWRGWSQSTGPQRERDAYAHPVPVEVALVHDYLTQRGGAERVALSLTHAFPEAPLYTSLFAPSTTFPEFAEVDVRGGLLNRFAPLRREHRLALPVLAPAFSAMRVDADVAVCSSSGWAHGARVTGRKIVYCHTPARWLYQPKRYLRGQGASLRLAAAALRAPLMRWDKAAAASADLYIANSSVVARRIEEIYDREAEVLPPPPALTPAGRSESVAVIEPGFILCVSRLLPYKNVDAIVQAFDLLPDERLVVAGAGPEESVLRSAAPPNVAFVDRVSDEQLRWLYANCRFLVAASHEDFGLTPLEAASFGKPAVVLRWGGFLDTVDEGRTGLFFDTPSARAVAAALDEAGQTTWEADEIRAHAERFSEPRFIDRIRAIVAESA